MFECSGPRHKHLCAFLFNFHDEESEASVVKQVSRVTQLVEANLKLELGYVSSRTLVLRSTTFLYSE